MWVHLNGHLAWYDAQKRTRIEVEAAEGKSLVERLHQLGVPLAEIGLAVLNGRVVTLEDARVSGNDCIELYPPIGGGK